MGTTVYTAQIALPSAEAMKQFYSLMHAAEAAEDRWSRETGTEMLERMFNGGLNDDECSFFSACWNILINTGDFARLLCAYTTMEATFQDPGVDHVAFKPSLVQLIEDAELLPVVAEAYAEALADRDSWQAKALAAAKREESLKASVDVLGRRIAELERANTAQDDHINQQQDRIDTLEKKNGELGKYAGEVEHRLQQPIKLPKREIGVAYEFMSDHVVVSLAAVLTEAATAGFSVEVEGE